MNTKVNEGKLISGKEALIALANGDEVELQATGDMNWYDSTQWTVGELLCFKGRFRLKPRTITLNSIEVPAPFEPKEDCLVYILDDSRQEGFREYDYDIEDTGALFFGVWRAKDEIKQVVSALRSIFKGGV